MKKRIFCICCCMALFLAGCTAAGPVAVSSDPAPAAEESAPAKSQPEAAGNEAEAPPVEIPPLPYDETVASVTPALAQLAAQHRVQYPDTVGWLRIPGTTIDNAVVQSDDITNEYYLNHDLDGNEDRNGTYSAKTHCRLTGGRENISRNISLFAHNHDENPNGILFAQLKKFKDPAYARANPYIYFSTPDEDMVWEVFAVFDTVMQYEYIHNDPSWARQRRLLETVLDASIYDYGITPGRDDRFLTLSTCSFDIPGVGMLPITTTNDYRFVVMARLVDPGEAKKDEAAIIPRAQFLLPDDFPLHDDTIWLDGWCYYLREDVFDDPLVQPLEPSALVLQGTVKRTTMSPEQQDWDATQLPVGAEIYADPAYPRLLVVDHDGERLYYLPDTTRLLLMRDNEVLAIRAIDNTAAELLWPEEMQEQGWEDRELTDSTVPQPPAGALVIVAENRNDRYTYRVPYYLATPPSIGKEVMLWRQYGQNTYTDAAVFAQLLDWFAVDVG